MPAQRFQAFDYDKQEWIEGEQKALNQTHEACRDRWNELERIIQALRMRESAGMDVRADEAHMFRLIEELRSYREAGLMPVDVEKAWDQKF